MTQMNDYLQHIRTALAHAALQGEAYNALRRMVEDECLVCGGGGQVLDTPCWKKRLIDCKPCLGTGKVLRDISQRRPGEFRGGLESAVIAMIPDSGWSKLSNWMYELERAFSHTTNDEEAASLVAEALEKNLEVKK